MMKQQGRYRALAVCLVAFCMGTAHAEQLDTQDAAGDELTEYTLTLTIKDEDQMILSTKIPMNGKSNVVVFGRETGFVRNAAQHGDNCTLVQDTVFSGVKLDAGARSLGEGRVYFVMDIDISHLDSMPRVRVSPGCSMDLPRVSRYKTTMRRTLYEDEEIELPMELTSQDGESNEKKQRRKYTLNLLVSTEN